MHIELVPAELWHAVSLAPRLRESDVQELQAVSEETPVTILIDAILISSTAFCVLRDGEPQILTGAAPIENHLGLALGSIWMLASDDMYRWRKQFMHLSRRVVNTLHQEYEILTNYIDERNLASSAWLPRLGFELGERIPEYGIERRPFIQFTSTR